MNVIVSDGLLSNMFTRELDNFLVFIDRDLLMKNYFFYCDVKHLGQVSVFSKKLFKILIYDIGQPYGMYKHLPYNDKKSTEPTSSILTANNMGNLFYIWLSILVLVFIVALLRVVFWGR